LADAIRFSDGTGYRDRALPAGYKAVLVDLMARHDLDDYRIDIATVFDPSQSVNG
jgi:hypothetical protein